MKEVKRLLAGLILTGFAVAILAGCATPSEQNASIASSASAELASNPCTLQQETVDKYSFISDAVTPIDMARLSLPDVRAGKTVPQLSMIDMEYAGWFTLASIPEIDFYLYGYTKGQRSGESGVVVDYGAEQHVYYFSSLQYGAPRTGEPMLYLSANGDCVTAILPVSYGTDGSYYCAAAAFLLGEDNLTMISVNNADVLDAFYDSVTLTSDNNTYSVWRRGILLGTSGVSLNSNDTGPRYYTFANTMDFYWAQDTLYARVTPWLEAASADMEIPYDEPMPLSAPLILNREQRCFTFGDVRTG